MATLLKLEGTSASWGGASVRQSLDARLGSLYVQVALAALVLRLAAEVGLGRASIAAANRVAATYGSAVFGPLR